MSRGWVTFSGKRFHCLNPRAEDMAIEDVAHHLAYQCRYNGACKPFYSVAEHCVIGSQLIHTLFPDHITNNQNLALDFLMHDCPETWTGDMIRPMKHETPLKRIFEEIEDRIYGVAAQRFGLSNPLHPIIKEMDNAMGEIEKRLLFPHHPNPEDFRHDIFPQVDRLPCWKHYSAEERFLERYEELTGAQVKRLSL